MKKHLLKTEGYARKSSGMFVFTCLTMLLYGCDSQHSESSVTTVSPQSQSEQNLVTRSATLLPEGVPGKPNAGINVEYEIPESIQPGEVVSVEIRFDPTATEGILLIDIAAENITLVNSAESFEFSLDQNTEFITEISVYSGEPVKAYLNLFMTLKNEAGQKTSQVVSIPVQIGEVPAAVNNQKATEENGKNLHILPAQETIISNED